MATKGKRQEKAPPESLAAKKGLLTRAWGGLLDLWFEPISPARLRIFEKTFAITFIYYVASWGLYAREWLTTDGFHFTPEVTSASYPPPMPPLPPEWLVPFMLLIFIAPTMVILGIRRRPALMLTWLCAIYIQLVEIAAAFTLNKLYIIFFLVLLLAPDPQKIRLKKDEEPQLRQTAWPVRIIQATLVIQYCSAGICKVVHGDWLKRVDILYGHSAGLYRNHLATWAIHNLPNWAWGVQGVIALCFEVFAPALFLIKKLRWVGIIVGVGMHIFIALLMKDLIFFSAQMITFYVLFLPDRFVDPVDTWVEGKLDRFLGRLRPTAP
jgi:hypothetical protein